MKNIVFPAEYFNVKDTLSCGQVFRFFKTKDGYNIISLDKCAHLSEKNGFVTITVEDKDEEYFKTYFDLKKDYSEIVSFAFSEKDEIVRKSAALGKGVRILRQDKTETLFSFIVSQNNNIARIKGIIERLCAALGDKKEFMGEEYYAFPSVASLAKASLDFYKGIGLGYRAPYVKRLAEEMESGLNINEFSALDTPSLKKRLTSIYGVGPKVADCVVFFGFNRTDAFPVDTWIEKVYVEDFKGTIKDRKKIAEYFVEKYGKNAGYIQQYLFYYKRSLKA